jgi:hypothetical protein
MLFGETVAVYCENHMEHRDTMCGQNAEFWYVKAGGTYSNQYVSHRKHITYPLQRPIIRTFNNLDKGSLPISPKYWGLAVISKHSFGWSESNEEMQYLSQYGLYLALNPIERALNTSVQQ